MPDFFLKVNYAQISDLYITVSDDGWTVSNEGLL